MRTGSALVLALLFTVAAHAAPPSACSGGDLAAAPLESATPTAAVAADATPVEPLFVASAAACCSIQEINACDDQCARRNCLGHSRCQLPQAECRCLCICMTD